MRRFIALFLFVVVLSGCAAQPPPSSEKPTPLVVQQTISVPQTVVVLQTALIPQTVVVVQTVVVPQTVVVRETILVMAVATATPTPPPAPTVAKQATTQPAARANGLTPEQLAATFKAVGLEAENVRPLTKDDYGLAPFVGSGVRFLIPSLCEDCGGRIFQVDNADDLARLKAYYDDLSKVSAAFFSWVFVRGGTLVQINGDLPEERARNYESALNSAQ